MTVPPILAAAGVTVRMGGSIALDGVTLSLAPGSMTALLGPNGSGKTTLIRVLAGVLRPNAGAVHLGAAPLLAMGRSAVAREVAYLPQQTATNFALRVEDAVALGRYPHLGAFAGMRPKDYEVVRWALERVGLTALRHRTLPTLSGGERQRAFIARALAQHAPILLLDEPLASLDVARQGELLALLADLHAEGRTVLASLHDFRPALDYFSRAVLLNGGRLAAVGSADEVVLGPALETTFGVRVRRGVGWCIERGGSSVEPPR